MHYVGRYNTFTLFKLILKSLDLCEFMLAGRSMLGQGPVTVNSQRLDGRRFRNLEDKLIEDMQYIYIMNSTVAFNIKKCKARNFRGDVESQGTKKNIWDKKRGRMEQILLCASGSYKGSKVLHCFTIKGHTGLTKQKQQ